MRTPPLSGLRPPFPGLRPFLAEDADLFYGRDREIQDLLDRLAAFRFVSVAGVSGCGKSSLVRAGVVPVLQSGFATELPGEWIVVTVRPGASPISELRSALQIQFAGLIHAEWPSTSYALVDLLQSGLRPGASLLLIVDQFEEIFRFRRQSLPRDGGNEAALFVNLILNVTEQRNHPACVLLTMRSDYLGECAQFSRLPAAINQSPYLVPRLTRNQRREAIEGPLRMMDIRIAPQLIETLLNESSEEPDDLPLLQHSLMRLWQDWVRKDDPGKPLDFENYMATGTVQEAISLHADEALEDVLKNVGEQGEMIVRRIFQRLTERDAEGRETRRPSSMLELSKVAQTSLETACAVVDCFRQEGRNFLTPYTGRLSESTQVDVTHECLLRRWNLLRREWLPEEDHSRRIYMRLATRAEDAVVRVPQPDGSSVPATPYQFEDSMSGVLLQQTLDWWDRRKPSEAWASRYHPEFAIAHAYLIASKNKNAHSLVSGWDDAPDVVEKLSSACEVFDWGRVDSLCRELINRIRHATEPFPPREARLILFRLRRARRFKDVEAIAEAMIKRGDNRAQVLRAYAQTMIDQGNLQPALPVIMSILSDEYATANEKAEAQTLLGRLHKIRYVDSVSPRTAEQQEELRLAIMSYFGAYRSDPDVHIFAGVNLVALYARAVRDNVYVAGFADAPKIAERIEQTLKHRKESQALELWEIASAVEIYIALWKVEEALKSVHEYVNHPSINAFECEALLRQLTGVWLLIVNEEPGASILPPLWAALLRMSGGEIGLTQPLQRVFADDRWQGLDWYKTGLMRSQAVARVESPGGILLGTGFLVRGEEFFPGLSRILFVTCTHILELSGTADRRPAVRIRFTENARVCDVEEVYWSSPVKDLDVTFLSLKGLDDSMPVLPVSPKRVRMTVPAPRAYIIGHAGERGLRVSDGALLNTDGRLLQYGAAAEQGTSGSPICDDVEWQVIGIHRSGTPEANIGITVEAIRDRLQKGLAAPEPRVFISYHRSSSAGWAALLQERLEHDYGFAVVVSEYFELALTERVRRAIQSADVFVCLLSRSTLDSAWIREEIRIASEAGKPMIPVFLESFRMPSEETDLSRPVQELLRCNGAQLDANHPGAATERLAGIIRYYLKT